jgi:transposase
MDGFTGFKTAAAEEVPDAVAVMDPFHVVALAGHALDRLYGIRRGDQPRHPQRPRRTDSARTNLESASDRRAGLLRPTRYQQRTRRGHQTADWNTSEEPHAAFAN